MYISNKYKDINNVKLNFDEINHIINHYNSDHVRIPSETQMDVKKPGIVYITNIPPEIKPISVRQLLSKYGEIGRVFLKKGVKYFYRLGTRGYCW